MPLPRSFKNWVENARFLSAVLPFAAPLKTAPRSEGVIVRLDLTLSARLPKIKIALHFVSLGFRCRSVSLLLFSPDDPHSQGELAAEGVFWCFRSFK